MSELKAERFLKDMVAVPSVTGSEGLIADCIAGGFRQAGMDVRTQPVDNDRRNVIGTIGKGPIKLMLCTHMDVIPPLDLSKWRSPPFEPSIRNGRIYGRGSCDAKGSLAAMTEAMGKAAEAADKAGCSIALAAVVDEESCGSMGAVKLMEEYAPAMGIIGEPTGLRVAIAHKGAIRPLITVHGRAAHASRPREGVNAIMLMGDALMELYEYGKSVGKRTDPLLGRASMEVTMIKGGDKSNVIPEKCDIVIDRRLVRGETVDSAFAEMRRIVSRIGKKIDARMDVELKCAYPPSGVNESEKIVSVARSSLLSLGLPDTPVGFPAGCDMWSFTKKGIPAIVLGPGSLEQAHVIDEYIEISQLNMAVKVYESIIRSVTL